MINNPLDTFYAFKFIYLMAKKWEDTDAFKLGIVNETGKPLKKYSELETQEEKIAYNRFNRLVFKIKRIVEKVPLANSQFGRVATAIALIREDYTSNVEHIFVDFLLEHNIKLNDNTVSFIIEDTNNELEFILGMPFKRVNGMLEMVTTGGIDMTDSRLVKKSKFEDTEQYAGDIVFACDPENFQKCMMGKKHRTWYKTYFGDTEVGKTVREYAKRYPDKRIIIKDAASGSMVYFKRGKIC